MSLTCSDLHIHVFFFSQCVSDPFSARDLRSFGSHAPRINREKEQWLPGIERQSVIGPFRSKREPIETSLATLNEINRIITFLFAVYRMKG